MADDDELPEVRRMLTDAMARAETIDHDIAAILARPFPTPTPRVCRVCRVPLPARSHNLYCRACGRQSRPRRKV